MSWSVWCLPLAMHCLLAFFFIFIFWYVIFSVYLLSGQECQSWLRCVPLAFLPVILSLPLPVTPKRAVDRFQTVSREGLFHLWESGAVQSSPFPALHWLLES